MTTATKSKRKWSRLSSEKTPNPGEGHLAFVRRRLEKDPPWEGGDIRVLAPNQAPCRRDRRKEFKGTKLAPDGVWIGGYELYKTDLNNNYQFFSFGYDLCHTELEELRCYLNGARRMTSDERNVQRTENEKRRREMLTTGTLVESASNEEKYARALRQLEGIPDAKKRAVLLLLLDEEEPAPK